MNSYKIKTRYYEDLITVIQVMLYDVPDLEIVYTRNYVCKFKTSLSVVELLKILSKETYLSSFNIKKCKGVWSIYGKGKNGRA
jgi:hypothetical protein